MNLTDPDNTPGARGVYTSEFWVMVLVVVAASVLLAIDAVTEETWRWAVGPAAGAYVLSRGIAKT